MWHYDAKYTNHLGRTVEFGDSTGIYLDEGALFGYAWDAAYTSRRITGTSRAVREVEMSFLHLTTVSPEMAAAFYETIDADAMAGKTGVLEVNGYQMRGVFIASSLDEYWHKKGMMRRACTFLAQDASWIRPVMHRYRIQEQMYEPRKTVEEAGERGAKGLAYPHAYAYGYGGVGGELPNTGWPYALDYRYGYPYDYMRWDRTSEPLENPSAFPATLLIRIYGPAYSPAVTVAGNRYEVGINVPDNHQLVIDGARRLVQLLDPYGVATDAFGARNKGQQGSGAYIFEPLQPGDAQVAWDNSFAFDIEVQMKRSAPPVWK